MLVEKEDIEFLKKKILTSKKYKGLYSNTVERIVIDYLTKYNRKEAENKLKTYLHQIWGAFYSKRPNFEKLYVKVVDEIAKGTAKEEILLNLLKIHSSTNERLPIISSFYSEIFKSTGKPSRIVDIGCGFNPLAYLWMNLDAKTQYFAYDIDKQQNDFLKKVLKELQTDIEFLIEEGDIFSDLKFPPADVVFLFKVLPSIETQRKGYAKTFIKNLNANNIVITFPLKSLSGNQKGMYEFYTDFMNAILETQSSYKKIEYNTELVYIVKNNYP